MSRKSSGNTDDYNPRWDLGIVPDGWPRAVGTSQGNGRRFQWCPSCGGKHLEGETPVACLEKLGRELEAKRAKEGYRD